MLLLIEVHAVILRENGQLKFLLTTLAWFDSIFLSTLWFIFLFENSNMTFVSTILFQGPRREWGAGAFAPPPPPHSFGWFFYFSKPGLSFAKKVHYIILCQICWPLRKRSLILISPFWFNLFFRGFSRRDTARWGSLSLGLFLNRRLDFRLRNNGI